MSRLIRINPRDNVAVALEPLKSGESALGVTLREVELKDANSIEEVQALCRRFIEQNHIPAGEVVRIVGQESVKLIVERKR